MKKFFWAFIAILGLGILSVFTGMKSLSKEINLTQKEIILYPTLNHAYDGYAYRHSHVSIDIKLLVKEKEQWLTLKEFGVPHTPLTRFEMLKNMQLPLGERPEQEQLKLEYVVSYDCQGSILRVMHTVDLPATGGVLKVPLKV